MDLKTQKLELLRLVLDTNNEKLLKKAKALLMHEKKGTAKAGRKPAKRIEQLDEEEVSISAEALWE